MLLGPAKCLLQSPILLVGLGLVGLGVLFLGRLGLAAEAEWPSPVTWKPDERAVKAGLYLEPLAPARRERVEFTVGEPSGVARERWPVRGAIPLFRGELADPKKIRLLEDGGKEIPVQGLATAFWPEKTIRFLCLDFLADLAPHEEKRYTLEYGAEVQPQAAAGLQVPVATAKAAEVRTGAVNFRFKAGTDFLQVELMKPGRMLPPITGRAIVCKDENGTQPATLALSIDELTVVEQGPVQVTVHLAGHYGDRKAHAPANDPGAWRFPASLYARVYAATGHVCLEHTFGYNGDEFTEFLSSYGLVIPTGLTTGRFAYGPDDTGAAEAPLGVRLNQWAHDHWDLSGKAQAAGKRFGGWAVVQGDSLRVLACVREAWQNWPVGFQADEKGTLVCEILGEKPGRALDLCYQDAGGKIHKSHSMQFGDALDDDYDTPWNKGRAAGLAKFHELLLDFSDGHTPAKQVGQGHQTPLLPFPAPKRIAETGALGPLAVYDDPKKEYLKEYFSVLLDAYPVIHEANGLFGWVDWGDMPMVGGFKGGKFQLSLAGGVGWSNGERGLAPYFYHYAAGGGRRFLDLGRAMAHHTLGLDVEHRGGEGDGHMRIGGYHRHSQVHWRSECGVRQGGYRGWNVYYWLTGDPEVGHQALEYGIDAPAQRMTMNLAPETAEPSVNHDYQSSAPHTVAHWNWITSGNGRFARAHHAIAKLWAICGEQGKAPQNGWIFFQVKNGEPAGYTLGAAGAMGGYWVTYGEDDLLLDWTALTGDPAAVDAILAQGKLHKGDGALYHSPEALYVSLAYLDPAHAQLKRWLDTRLWMHSELKRFKDKALKTPAAYKSPEEWHKLAGDGGLGLFGSGGKNGFSIHGAEALEILLLLHAQEVLAGNRPVRKQARAPVPEAAPPTAAKKLEPAAAPKPAAPAQVTPEALTAWNAKLEARIRQGVQAGQQPVVFLRLMGPEDRVKVRGADGKNLQVELQGHTMPVAWSSLTARDRMRLAQGFLKEGGLEDHLLVAVFALADEHVDVAEDHFAKAQAADPKSGATRVAEARATLYGKGP